MSRSFLSRSILRIIVVLGIGLSFSSSRLIIRKIIIIIIVVLCRMSLVMWFMIRGRGRGVFRKLIYRR